MPRKSDKRERLLGTAIETVHRQGFNQTTLADIASEAKVPLGNVYYYFKTKQEIGDAIIDLRLQQYQLLREQWDELPGPKQRLLSFIDMTVQNREKLVESGCPVGTLCTELQKQGGALAERASGIFDEHLDWLQAQFKALGAGKRARLRAIELLSALEGATLLSHSFDSSEFIDVETRRLKRWVKDQ